MGVFLKVIFKQVCQLLTIISHKNEQWIQERASDTPTMGLSWAERRPHLGKSICFPKPEQELLHKCIRTWHVCSNFPRQMFESILVFRIRPAGCTRPGSWCVLGVHAALFRAERWADLLSVLQRFTMTGKDHAV